MPNDRLRHDHDNVEDLDDLIEARDEGTSHLAWDIDSAEKDFEIPEDIDVDDALTFPHPKHKKNPNADIDLMGTPREHDTDVNWAESQEEMLPTDYEEAFNEMLTTIPEDEEIAAEEQIEDMGEIKPDEPIEDEAVEISIPEKKFRPDEDEE